MSEVDLSYKINARKAWYDIEVLEDVFTLVIVSEGHIRFISIESPHYQHNPGDRVKSSLKDMMDSISLAKEANIVGDGYNISLLRASTDDKVALVRVQGVIDHLLECVDLDDYESFTEYYGWNSSRYDVPMLIAISTRLSSGGNDDVCHDFKSYSDALIGYDGPPWGQMKHLAEVVAKSTR